MDLGAFLRPGGIFPVTALAEGESQPAAGHLLERRGRPLWVADAPQPHGRVLTIRVELPGFRLAEDGSLTPAEAEALVPLILLGQVRGCRFFPPRQLYVLRLTLLGRVDP